MDARMTQTNAAQPSAVPARRHRRCWRKVSPSLERSSTNQERALPGATVTLTGPAGRETRVTDAAGEYQFVAVVPGDYQISAASPGFASGRADRRRGRRTAVTVAPSDADRGAPRRNRRRERVPKRVDGLGRAGHHDRRAGEHARGAAFTEATPMSSARCPA